MSAQSIPTVVMASISFYVGVYHFLIYFRRRQHREDLTFALMCLATGFYDVFCAGLYSATSVAEGAQWQRLQFIALAFFTTTFLWFVSDYTRQKRSLVTHAISVFYMLAAVVQAVDRSSLTWLVDQPSIKEILLPLGLKVTYYEATLGPFTTVQSLMGMVAGTYIVWSGVRFYRHGYKREAVPLLVALGFVYAAALNDTAVSNGLYQFVYAIEYGYLAMILLMAFSLLSTVVEAGMMRDALRASEERFRSLVETTSDWVWEVDRNGTYTYASPKLYDLLGYRPEEILGKTPFDLMAPDETEGMDAIFRDAVVNQRPLERLENTARRKDGRLVVLETSGVPFLDAQGRVLGYRGIDRDITKRKRVEEALHETNETLRALIQSSPLSIVAIDLNERVTLWNPAAEQMFGWQECEVLGQTLPIVPEDKRGELSLLTERALQGEALTDVVTRRRKKDGSPIDLSLSTAPLRDAQGHVVGVMGVSVDITERKHMEAALQQHAQELATLNALGQQVNATLSVEQVVQAATVGIAGPVQCDLVLFFLREGDELVLQSVGPSASPVGAQGVPAHRVGECLCGLAVSAGRPIFSRDIHNDPYCTKAECRRAGLHSFAALPLFSGDEVVGVLGLASTAERDFGEQATFLETMANQIATASQNALLHKQVQRHAVELEQRVIERTAQLEAAVKELEAFSYSVSHDLRAPLRAIDGFTRILAEDYGPSLDAEGKRVCAVISENTRRMGQLIDDLLAFSRLSRAEMQPMPIDMEALANWAFQQLTTAESRERIDFRLGALPAAVGDPTLVGQVWTNLLSNAIKFSSKEERAVVEVGCRQSEGETVYYVRDNGAGFDMRYAGKLFGVFQRLHSEREFEGTGVGLAIVQRMIHRHGGRIWAEAVPDGGATFYFTLR